MLGWRRPSPGARRDRRAGRVQGGGSRRKRSPGRAADRLRAGRAAPEINAATIRVAQPRRRRRRSAERRRLLRLARCITWAGEAPGAGRRAHNIDAWLREIERDGLEAIVVTASGCGSTIKDYGPMFADDPAYAEKARRVAALAKDPSEYFASLDLDYRIRKN